MSKEKAAKDESLPVQEAQTGKPSGLLTLEQLAEKHGQLIWTPAVEKAMRFRASDPHESPFKPTHQAASVLHGWRSFEHKKHEKVLLSDADYLAALEAAKKGKTHAQANKRDPAEEAEKQARRDEAARIEAGQSAKGAN